MKNVTLKSFVLAFAALMSFGTGSAVADVQVDQSPLIVAEPLPPNIILMHDDSGSMTWGFMPSWGEMPDTNDETLRASEVNRLYYNPSVTYEPPLKADGVPYADIESFPTAPLDGLDDDSSEVDIESYTMQDPVYGVYEFPLYTRLADGDSECPPGTEPSSSYPGECYSSEYYSGEYVFYTGRFFDSGNDYWYYDEVAGFGCPPGTSSSGIYAGKCYTRDELDEQTVDYGNGDLRSNGYYYYSQICADGDCVPPKNVFAYSLGSGSPYAERFVTDDCSQVPSDYQDQCDDSTEIQRNVANWFAYYRTRELAAKSGMLTAFAGINPEYRVGYASINNNNGSSAPFRFGSTAQVDLSDDSYPSHVNRENFWRWMEGVYSSGGTPLRGSLKEIGEYYKNEDVPWQEGYDEDGNYSSEKYSCRQSYAILLTDGYWNGGNPSVGNADNLDGSEILSPDGQTTYQYEPEAPFSDEHSDTLADVAMVYWKADLRDDLKNDVPTTGRDPGFWQHMTTFTIGLGVSPVNIEPSDATLPEIFEWARTGSEPTGFDANQFLWPEPDDDEPETITDLAHAAVNGHGGFYSAADPREFTRGLSEALAAIDNASGAGNSVSLSGGASEVVKDGSLSFVGKYVTGEWSGSLKAFSYSSTTGKFETEEWSAAAQMPAAADRNIWTTDDGSVVEFVAGELSGDLKTRLSANIDTPFDVSGNDIVAYLRGDRSYEDAQSSPLGSALRQRASLLGDIVSSTPVPVGAPEPKASAFDYAANGFEGLDSYSTFVEDYKDREPMVYVAANDGMLHGFKQSTGEETFAFLPGSLLDVDGDASLARYANPQYGIYDEVSGNQEIPHQYYNDGEMTTENVFIGGVWKTVLVGTTGRGPTRTVYAIDVTDPSVLADPDDAEDAILWERSAADGGDYEWIGQVLGRPTIWQVPDTGNKTKWVALIGNGPNSGDDEAALLQFDLADGDLEVIETNNDKNNGLAAPTVIMTDPASGIADYAFAGDLRGNVWQFDLDKGRSEKVFEAVGPDGEEQPITARMNATAHPSDGSIWLFFGTGRFLAEDDIDRRDVQSLYGLRVQARTSGKPVVDDSSTRDNDLVERSIVAQEENDDLIERATELGSESDLNPDKAGWFMDLIYDDEAEGERILNIAQLVAGSLYVTTMIPIAGDPCSALPPGATMILDPFSGANPGSEFLALDGYGNLGSIGDIPVNAYITKAGVAGAPTFAINEAGETIGVAQNVSGETIDVPAPPAGAGGATRLNWQELYAR